MMTKTWISLIAAASASLLTACGGGDDDNARRDHLFYQARSFDLQAHRGGLGLGQID